MSPQTIRFYDADDDNGWCSNLFPRRIWFDGVEFRSAEEAYQYGKPMNKAVAKWLIAAPEQSLVAKGAHALQSHQVREDWVTSKVDRMLDVLRAKFRQHDDLAERLTNTKNAILKENSPSDRFWGVVSSKKDNTETGHNVLGVLLEHVRSELQRGGELPPPIIVFDRVGKYSWCSNFHPCSVDFKQIRFESAEAAYQYDTVNEDRLRVAEWLIAAPEAAVISEVREVLSTHHFKKNGSKEDRKDRMREVLRAKFVQHPHLAQELKNTGSAILMDARADSFWGIGKSGGGQNNLGKLLSEIR